MNNEKNDLVKLYVNRDEVHNEESFFLKRTENAPHVQKMFNSGEEYLNMPNFYSQFSVKPPNTYFDHIKQINSTLNFKMQPTSYTEAYEYSNKKKENTLHPDDLHHYKKSFMKTYEECKLKNLHVIRK